MLRKSILISLFERILESSGRVGKAIVPMCFFSGGTGNLEGLFTWAVKGSTHVNGLSVNEGHIGVNERILTV